MHLLISPYSGYEYWWYGKWLNQPHPNNDCSDPKELFEKIVFQRKNVVDLTAIKYYNDDNDQWRTRPGKY